MTEHMLLRRIVEFLPRFAYRFGDEKQLHEGIATVLQQHGVGFQREYVASKEDRFDFLCDGGIVIEAKIHGSLSPALRQAARYAKHDMVCAIVIATSRHWGGARKLRAGATMNGKPVKMVQLRGQSF